MQWLQSLFLRSEVSLKDHLLNWFGIVILFILPTRKGACRAIVIIDADMNFQYFFSFECYSIPDVVSFSLSPYINWGQSWRGDGGVALPSDFVEYCSTLYCSGHQKRWCSILTGSHRGTPYPLQKALPWSLNHTQNALCYPHSRWHSQVIMNSLLASYLSPAV